MRYRFDDIEAFIGVVETTSVSAAARRLGLSKSVISKRVSDLEAMLGAELLQRSSRRVAPTDAGLQFYQRACSILRQLDEAAEDVSAEHQALRGHLRIALPMSFGRSLIAPMLYPLLAQNPDLSMSLDFEDRRVDLLGEGYDLGVRIGRLPDSSLVARKLADSRRLIVASPGYLAEHGRPQSLDDLARHRCIAYANQPVAQQWAFEPARKGEPPRSVPVHARISANNGEAICDMAVAGLGLAVLPDFIAAEPLRQGRLQVALSRPAPLGEGVYAVFPASRHRSRKLRVVVDTLVAAFADPPWTRDLPD